MADINISIGCAHYINVQAACALQQVQKSSELIDSACNLQQEICCRNQSAYAHGLEAAMDV